MTYLPGNTVSSVAIAHGVAPAVLFRWRALDKQGALTTIQAGEATVSARKYEAALEEIKRLQRLLGQATADNALLKDAVEYMQSKKMDCELAMIRSNHSISRTCDYSA